MRLKPLTSAFVIVAGVFALMTTIQISGITTTADHLVSNCDGLHDNEPLQNRSFASDEIGVATGRVAAKFSVPLHEAPPENDSNSSLINHGFLSSNHEFDRVIRQADAASHSASWMKLRQITSITGESRATASVGLSCWSRQLTQPSARICKGGIDA